MRLSTRQARHSTISCEETSDVDDKQPVDVVTGAFGYTGKYITRRLLAMGRSVRSLTNHPGRENPFGEKVTCAPLDFTNPSVLRDSLQGATTLYNTYWVRFPYGDITYEKAVANTRVLIDAARAAGVRKFVHVSIANADESSPLPYYHGKGVLEKAVIASGLEYVILRPTVIFGPEDILINNIAWFLRKFPVFGIPGSGTYGVQPIFVEDLAEIAVGAASQSESQVVDTVGPETFSFEALVRLIAAAINSRARVLRVRPGLALALLRLVGWAVGDVVLTREEIEGLRANLLVGAGPPVGQTRLSDWLRDNADRVGTRYASELKRHYR
jgi:NADH dehydrogenase